MKPLVGPLMPPNTPPGLPHGLQRGGVFEAPYVNRTYIDANRSTVPTDSPVSPDVPVDVFARPIAFSRPDVARPITGPMPGMGATYMTSYDKGHRHSVTIPSQTRMAAGHRHAIAGSRGMPTMINPFAGSGGKPTVLSPFGQHVQGMGPQPGFMLESPDPPPLAIGPAHPVATPRGHAEGGIFGPGRVPSMATGPGVAPVPTTGIMQARRLTGPITLAGYGAGPDGLG